MSQYRVYLDVCCLNRPLDHSSQERIRLEAEAVLSIYEKCRLGEWILLTSDIIDAELRQIPNPQKIRLIYAALVIAQDKAILSNSLKQRTNELVQMGFKAFDSAHIASAETLTADIFLTTDDRLLRRAKTYSDDLKVAVENPVIWLLNLSFNEGDSLDENTNRNQ